jgi:hypothetical protein
MANATNQLDKATRKLVRSWSPESIAGSLGDELNSYLSALKEQMHIHGRDPQIVVHVAMLELAAKKFWGLQLELKRIEMEALERLEDHG